MAGTDDLCRAFLDLWFHFDPTAAPRAGVPGQDESVFAYGGLPVPLIRWGLGLDG